MVTSTLEEAPFVIDPAAERETTNAVCHICRAFGSEACDLLRDLGNYRQTEDAVRKVVEREERLARTAKS